MRFRAAKKALTEDVGTSNPDAEATRRAFIFNILMKIGEAHDKIMEAQDDIADVKYDDVRDDDDSEFVSGTLDNLGYILDDLEAELSEYDFMGEDDPVTACLDKID